MVNILPIKYFCKKKKMEGNKLLAVKTLSLPHTRKVYSKNFPS